MESIEFLLERTGVVLKLGNYSYRTQRAYIRCISEYVSWNVSQYQSEAEKLESFLILKRDAGLALKKFGRGFTASNLGPYRTGLDI